MDLLKTLEAYQPVNEQERRDQAEILRRVRSGETLLTRDNLSAHFTASAWVTDPAHRQVLMAHHDLYNSWAWLGGHADGEADLLAVALREVQEESGLTDLRPVSVSPCSLEILTVLGHEKRGVYVPSHLHFNLTFLVEADPTAPLRACPGEISRVAWFTPEGAIAASSEPWFQQRIYPKLNRRL